MILVTGATGNVGAQVVRELRERGAPVRAFVRDAARARRLLGDEVELAVGDLAEPAAVARALAGATRVVLSTADGPAKPEHERAVIDAAAAAGVELVVKCSTIGAEVGSPLPPFDWHGQAEEHLRRSGVPAVVLRSCFYMTNLLASAEQVRATRKLVAPAGEGRVAMIDPRDTGSAAAAVLASDGHAGRTYVLTGARALGFADVARELGLATGDDVEYVDVPDAAAREALAASGLPDWLVGHLSGLFPRIREGLLAATTETVRELTGREPRTFAEFAREHAEAFAGGLVAGRR
ncbi:MAG TPA: NAD(P)H-binding protein [Gaiellaceae bacterium]|nr:NAD(P)H-binding protein [Gaiellaceae bacterium]